MPNAGIVFYLIICYSCRYIGGRFFGKKLNDWFLEIKLKKKGSFAGYFFYNNNSLLNSLTGIQNETIELTVLGIYLIKFNKIYS